MELSNKVLIFAISIAMTDNKSLPQPHSNAEPESRCCTMAQLLSKLHEDPNQIYTEPLIELSYGYLDERETTASSASMDAGSTSMQSLSTLLVNGYQPIRGSALLPPVITYKISLRVYVTLFHL